MRKTTTITAIILVLLFTSLNIPTATASENSNNGYQYYAYPILTAEGYAVNYGLNFSIGKQLNLQYYTKITAQLYSYLNDKWVKLAEHNFTASIMPGYQATHSYERKWETTWTFRSDITEHTWPLTVVFIWLDNMNLTNWVDFPDASDQINTTHWSHAVTWSKTFTIPVETQPTREPGGNQTLLIIFTAACLAVTIAFVVKLKRKPRVQESRYRH